MRKKNLKNSLDAIRGQVTLFVEKLTEEQYESLKTGSLDQFTRLQLVKLLTDVLASMTKLCVGHKSDFTEGKVRDLLGNHFAQIFASVLKVEGIAESMDVDSLNELIGQEVTKMVLSDHSDYTIQPNILDMILDKTIEMLQTFMAVKVAFPQGRDQLIEMEEADSDSSGEYYPQNNMERLNQTVNSPEESSERLNTPVEAVLLEELNAITSPLLQDVPEDQAEVVRQQTSEEMQTVLAELTEHKVKGRKALKSALAKVKRFFTKCFAKALIHSKVAELKAKTVPKCESETSLQMLAQDVDNLLKLLPPVEYYQESQSQFYCEDPNFTGQLFSVFHKGVTENVDYETDVETKVTPASDSGSIDEEIRDKMNKFIVLASWWMTTQLGGCCERVMVTLKHSQSVRPPQSLEVVPEQPEVSEDTSETHEDEEVISLDEKVKSGTDEDEEEMREMSEDEEDTSVACEDEEERREGSEVEDEEEMSDGLKLDSEVDIPSLTSEIREAEMSDNEDVEPTSPLMERIKEAQQQKIRMYIFTLVELLVGKLIQKAKFAVQEKDCIIDVLSEATFAKCSEHCFLSGKMDHEKLPDLRRDIYKHLCKNFGSAENLLFLLATNDELVMNATATIIRSHLTCQRQRNVIKRCARFVKKVFKKCFLGCIGNIPKVNRDFL